MLSVRPGITDWASIEYVDENVILGQAEDLDKAYIEQIMPDKIRYNMKWIENQGVVEYLKIIFSTFWGIARWSIWKQSGYFVHTSLCRRGERRIIMSYRATMETANSGSWLKVHG